jgi:hypothetical protein
VLLAEVRCPDHSTVLACCVLTCALSDVTAKMLCYCLHPMTGSAAQQAVIMCACLRHHHCCTQ